MSRAEGQLTILGDAASDHTVPADVLVQTVERLQRLMLLVAASRDGRDIRQRFRPSQEQRQQHQLRLGVPAAGSWSIPVQERSASWAGESESTLVPLLQFVDAVQAGKHADAARIIPQQVCRDFVLEDLRQMAPSDDSKWWINLAVKGHGEIRIDHKTKRSIVEFQRWEAPEAGPGYFIGEVHRVNFPRHEVTLVSPVSRNQFKATYPAETEETILRNRRELVLLRGKITRQGNEVVEVADVSMVEAVDLDPATISSFDVDGRTIDLGPPLRVTPRLDDESRQTFVFQEESLDIDVVAPTREDLLEEVVSALAFLWTTYALAGDGDLTDGAQRLKQRLRNRMKEK